MAIKGDICENYNSTIAIGARNIHLILLLLPVPGPSLNAQDRLSRYSLHLSGTVSEKSYTSMRANSRPDKLQIYL